MKTPRNLDEYQAQLRSSKKILEEQKMDVEQKAEDIESVSILLGLLKATRNQAIKCKKPWLAETLNNAINEY